MNTPKALYKTAHGCRAENAKGMARLPWEESDERWAMSDER
jgi:hypothetical protein